MNADQELRECFARQRRCDQEHAPAWNPRLIQTPAKRTTWHLPLWVPITAAACLLIGFTLMQTSPAPDLTSSLPEFFSTQGEPLFASIESSDVMPSDSFLPTYLTIQLP